MNIREINKPVTAKSLNESLAKRFGQKVAIDKFTLEQLQDARNRVRTSLSQIETNESFNTVKKEQYQKSKLFLDVLNAAIAERELVAEGECTCNCGKDPCIECGESHHNVKENAKPDYIDIDKDGDTKEPMKKAVKDKEEGNDEDEKKESIVKEGAEDQAELVMAAKDMVDRVTGWMEDTAEMQTESMLELADAIRDEKGQEASDAFVQTVKPALESLYTAMESTRQSLTQGVGQLTGEAEPVNTMGAEEPAAGEPAMEPTVDQEDTGVDLEGGDDFSAAAPAAGGEEEAGRAKRESIQRKKRAMLESSRRLGTILSKKK